jgi:hypothetical protein
MWQPAKLGRLSEFLWSSLPFDWHGASLSLAGNLGPFLLGAIAVGLLVVPPPDDALPWRTSLGWWRETPRRRAHLFVMLWLLAILAGATALPELNYFFRIRYGILPMVPVCVLLASVLGWFEQGRTAIPRWLWAVGVVLFVAQMAVSVDRSVRYRREFARVEVGVDQAYAWVAKYFPQDDLFLMPDFLAYDYHLDAPKAILLRRRVAGMAEVMESERSGRATVLSWQGPTTPLLRDAAQFSGCNGSLFDRFFGCSPGLTIHAMRYIGGAAAPVADASKVEAQVLLDRSFAACRQRQPRDCIKFAQEALRLSPGFAEAYNNIAAAYEDLGLWDEAISAAQEAIRLKPDFQLARNNLAWSESQKKAHAGPPAH